jgi:hypothetical protein
VLTLGDIAVRYSHLGPDAVRTIAEDMQRSQTELPLDRIYREARARRTKSGAYLIKAGKKDLTQ